MIRRALVPLQSTNTNSNLDQMATAPRKKLTHAEKMKERENVEPHRFALIFDPPTVVLEYRDKARDSLRHRKMQIPGSCLHDVDLAVKKLVRHNNIHLHPSVVSKEQVQRLVEKLFAQPDSSQREVKSVPKPQTLAPPPQSDPFSSGDPFADPFATPGPSLNKTEVMTGKLDLQKADEDVVTKAKEIMEEDFEKNALRPGDEGYVHDKRVEFDIAEGPGDWDEDSEEEEESPDIRSPGNRSLSSGGSALDTGSPVDHGDDEMYNF